MDKLLPCPFCGRDAVVVRHEYNGANDTFGVKCNGCKSQGNQFYETIDDAISMWNDRYHGVEWVLNEEDAKNYKIPEYAYCEKMHYEFKPFETDTRTHFCSYGVRKEGAE